jgi:ABC-type molybdenum transport system ATPase subunit/photorepair protein PhrA
VRGKARQPRPAAPTLISLRRASVWREGAPVLRQITCHSIVRRGDCWLVHGANGSGKSSFMQTLYGDLGVARGGSITRAGMEPGVPLQSSRRRVGFIAPELQAIYPRHLPVDWIWSPRACMPASASTSQRAARGERRRVLRALRRVGAPRWPQRTLRTPVLRPAAPGTVRARNGQ